MITREAYVAKLNAMTLTDLVNEYAVTGMRLSEVETEDERIRNQSAIFLIVGIGQFKFQQAWVAEIDAL